MSCESHTVINVAKKHGHKTYIHFFRVKIETHPQDCDAQITALREAFPFPALEIRVTYWECSGHKYVKNTDGNWVQV